MKKSWLLNNWNRKKQEFNKGSKFQLQLVRSINELTSCFYIGESMGLNCKAMYPIYYKRKEINT